MKRITSWALTLLFVFTSIILPVKTSNAIGELDYFKSHEKLVVNNKLIISVFGDNSSFNEITYEKDGVLHTTPIEPSLDYEDTGRLEAHIPVEETGEYRIGRIGNYAVEDSFTVYESIEEAYNGSLEVLFENGDVFESIYEAIGKVRSYNDKGELIEFKFKVNGEEYTGFYDGISMSVDFSEQLEDLSGEYTVEIYNDRDYITRNINLNPIIIEEEKVDGGTVQLSGQNVELSSYKDSPILRELIEEKTTLKRISGKNRFETAVAISENTFQRADVVVIVNSHNFPDALSAGSLAYNLEAPILFSAKDSLNSSTLNEIKRLGAKSVILVGGTASLDTNVEKTLEFNNLTVERISGKSRFETSIEIAKRLEKNTEIDTVILANGFSYPDALSIAPYSAMKNYPILYTDFNEIDDSVKKYLMVAGYPNILIVGGEASVSEDIENELKNLDFEVERTKGKNRYETSSKIAEKYIQDSKKVVLASGEDFPDALAGGVFAAKGKAPIMLTPKESLNQGASEYINQNNVFDVDLLGGEGVLSSELPDLVKNVYLNSETILNEYAVRKEGEEVEKEDPKPLEPTVPNKPFNTMSIAEKKIFKSTLPYNKPKKILIDPGHGAGRAHNRGFVGASQYANEGDNNYFISLILKEELEKRGYIVSMTRPNRGDNPGLEKRGSMAKGYDLFISVHSNAANAGVRGTEVYDDVIHTTAELSKKLSASSARVFGHNNRGMKLKYYSDTNRDNYYGVLRHSLAKHSMLVEYGFHTNAQDASLLMNNSHRRTLMSEQARIIHEYFQNR